MDSTTTTPIYFILSPGANVVGDLDKLADKYEFVKNESYHNVSMGQGQVTGRDMPSHEDMGGVGVKSDRVVMIVHVTLFIKVAQGLVSTRLLSYARVRRKHLNVNVVDSLASSYCIRGAETPCDKIMLSSHSLG